MTFFDRTLVIMAKAPRPGSVKTRLTKNLPVPEVTELYRCLLNDTIDLGQSLSKVDLALMCPAGDLEELSRAVPQTVRVVPQCGAGLAAGLDSVFARFAGNGGRRVIAFNSDSPHLPASALETAFDALDSQDLVVGPTHDGGYFLVGARASHPGLFSNDGLGTATALDALLQRASDLHLSAHLIERFYDIDVAADLHQLDEELRRVPSKAPRTAAWLAKWRQARAKNRSSIGTSIPVDPAES
jgi:hypothetical protein